MEKEQSYLGRVGNAVAPVFEPIGFGTWQAASSLITGVIAKEIVISTMGEVYAVSPHHGASKSEALSPETMVTHSFLEEIGGIVIGFFSACKDAVINSFATFGMASITLDSDSESHSLRNTLKSHFGPASAMSFMVFVLLYMPCIVTGIAMKQEFGSWKWFGVATAYGLTLAWGAAFVTYRIALLLGVMHDNRPCLWYWFAVFGHLVGGQRAFTQQ